MLNRGAVTIFYNQSAVDWINRVDPATDTTSIPLDTANDEPSIYLIALEDVENDDCLDSWLKKHFKIIFECELAEWYTDSNLWPQKLTYKLFKQWFTVKRHSILIDLVDSPPIEDDGEFL